MFEGMVPNAASCVREECGRSEEKASWSWGNIGANAGRRVISKREGRYPGEEQYQVCDPPRVSQPQEGRAGAGELIPFPSQVVHVFSLSTVANFDPGTFSLMRCDFCGAGFDTRAGLSSHARAHLRDFGITNWELTVSPINILQELLATSAAERPPSPLGREPGGPPGGYLTSRRPRLPLTVPFLPTWAEDPGPAYGDGKGREGGQVWSPDLPQEPRGTEGWEAGSHSIFLKVFPVTLQSTLTTVLTTALALRAHFCFSQGLAQGFS